MNDGVASNIGMILKQEFDDAAKEREVHEQKWADNLAMYRGKMGDKSETEIIFRIAKTKIEAITARLIDLLFPVSGDLNWGLESTPVPSLGGSIRDQIKQEMISQGQEVTQESFDAAIRAEAKKRAEAMEQEIKDQLAEDNGRIGFRELSRRVIRSGLIYGAGIIKGPLPSKKSKKKWEFVTKQEKDDTGKVVNEYEDWDLQQYEDDESTPYSEAVPIWDCYPDPSATDLTNARYVWQSRLMTRTELLELAERKDFKKDKIVAYIKNFPKGDAEKERMAADDKIQSVGGSAARKQETEYKYRVYERWGYLSGTELIDCGVDVESVLPGDPDGIYDYASNVWIIGNEVIKANKASVKGVPIPFFFFYYNKDETNIWGSGVCDDIGPIQVEINDTIKALKKNTEMSAGPQISVLVSALDASQANKVDQIAANGVWKFDNAEDIQNAFRLWEIPSKATQYIQLVQFYQNFIDELTAPRFISGDGNLKGAGSTMGGLSMLMGALNVNLKELVKNFDDNVTEPFITALYHWNMTLNPKEEIKGDFEIQARGSSSLVAKEVQSERLIKAVEVSSNPKFDGLVKDDDLLRELFKVMGVSMDLVRTAEEVQQYKFDLASQMARATLQAQMEELEKRGIDPGQALAGLFQQTAIQAQQMALPQQQGQVVA